MKAAALSCLFLASCAVEEVTVTESSKGSTVTTTRKSRKVDPQAWTFAEISAEYITRREIENRWRPLDEK